jgi:ornithine decarboxylase
MIDPFTSQALRTLCYETPFFLFSRDLLAEKYGEFEKFFPGAHVHYAMKANAEPEVLRKLAEIGSGFEVASKHELELLEDLHVGPDRIIYGTSVKPAQHIPAFVNYGVDRFACDSFSELEKIAAHAPGAKVYIRLAVNDKDSVFQFSEKFGTEPDKAVGLLKHARELGLTPYGISFHVGSQNTNPRAWAQAIQYLTPTVEELVEAGIIVSVLNIGGGFPCAYSSVSEEISLEEIANHTYAAYERLPYKPQLILEPGRAIIASAGILVAGIIARIERTNRTWLFLDVGVYGGLFEAMAYQGSTRYRVTSLSHNGGESEFAIAGPSGDSPDVITREALLPTNVTTGDKLVLHDVGAYSLVAISPFNGFPKPSVYFV